MWTKEPASSESQAQFEWLLTEYGQKVQIIFVYHKIPTIFAELRSKHEEFSRHTKAVQEQISEVGVEELLEAYDSEYSS